MTRLKVDGVSKVYKEKTALHPCSFEAEAGSCVVLCGGNGAGKSTLLQMIAAISTPTTGTTIIDDINIKDDRESYLKKIGFMPDDFYAQEMMTVEEFLNFYGAFRKVTKERINQVIELIGLTDKRRELVKSLSKGMRQRLIFGQSILAEPAVLLMDEPTNGLDPYWVNRFVEIVSEIKKSGTTIVFSTHMMDVAAETGDLIVFMKQGEVIEKIVHKRTVEETTIQLMKLHRQ